VATKDDAPGGPRRFRYKLEDAALNGAGRLVPKLPRGAMLALARAAGSLGYHLLAEDRRVALANLDLAFGDAMPPREKRRIARSAFRNLARALLGLLWAPRLSADNIRDYAHVDDAGWQHYERLKAAGKGVIVITPHYGDWELMSLACGFFGLKYTTVMEPTKNPAIEQMISRLRCLSGHTTVHPRFAMVKLFKALSRRQDVGVLIDVNARRGRGGVWLDFFGLPVFNTAAIVQMAQRTGAAILFGYSEPLPDGRIVIRVGPEVVPDDTGDPDADVLSTSQKCLDLCQNLIRDKPDYWLWTYKRWKRRPSPEQGRYPFYSKYDPNT
jgi:lauroyl/myristoyl acyltransferase